MPQAPSTNGTSHRTRTPLRRPRVGKADREPPASLRHDTTNGHATASPPGDERNGQQPTDPSPFPDGSPTGPAAAPTGTVGRDAAGRFTKGNAGGPGNPFARQTARLRQALCARVREADIEALADQLLQRARDGDLAAMRLLLVYVVGRPTPVVDPDTLDQAEWRLYQQTPVPMPQLEAILGGLPASVACWLLRASLPYLAANHAITLLELLERLPGWADATTAAPATAADPKAPPSPAPDPREHEPDASRPASPPPPRPRAAQPRPAAGASETPGRPVPTSDGSRAGNPDAAEQPSQKQGKQGPSEPRQHMAPPQARSARQPDRSASSSPRAPSATSPRPRPLAREESNGRRPAVGTPSPAPGGGKQPHPLAQTAGSAVNKRGLTAGEPNPAPSPNRPPQPAPVTRRTRPTKKRTP